MIDGTPALTITLPIQRRNPDFRALGNARHAQVRLGHFGADPLHPFVQDGERTRIGVDLHTDRHSHAVGGDVTVDRPNQRRL